MVLMCIPQSPNSVSPGANTHTIPIASKLAPQPKHSQPSPPNFLTVEVCRASNMACPTTINMWTSFHDNPASPVTHVTPFSSYERVA
jgi:hypothetical protein